MTQVIEKETRYWVCTCGKKGRPLVWHKSVRAGIRHIKEHERKLEWGFDFDMDGWVSSES